MVRAVVAVAKGIGFVHLKDKQQKAILLDQ